MSMRSLVTYRPGRWERVLRGIEVDHVITDPPYGERTHRGQKHKRTTQAAGSQVSSDGLPYPYWTPADVSAFVADWAPRTRGWLCAFTSHDLVPAYEAALEAAGRYVFAPLSCVIPGMNVRLAGDGPANWTVWLMVSRPVGMRPLWGSLPGSYRAAKEVRRDGLRIAGSKPLGLMLDIIEHYSRPGDCIADPCAGVGVGLIAAALRGRRAIGAECAPQTYELGQKRIEKDLAFPRAESEALS